MPLMTGESGWDDGCRTGETKETKVMDEGQMVNRKRFDLCSVDLNILQDYFHLS